VGQSLFYWCYWQLQPGKCLGMALIPGKFRDVQPGGNSENRIVLLPE
jgi:hypothetical protein